MKIAIVSKSTPRRTDVIDLSQACGASCQGELAVEQCLTISYAGGRCFYFDTSHHDFFRVVREPFQDSISISREPTTPERIVAYYEAV